MSDVFLSYARSDTERVRPLAEALSKAGARLGFDVWWDPMLPIGKTWDEYLQMALDSAKCILVVWSDASVQSTYVRGEAEEGRERGILVPVILDDVKLPLSFKLIQTADLTTWKPGAEHAEFDRLLNAIAKLATAPSTYPAPTPVQPTTTDTYRRAVDAMKIGEWQIAGELFERVLRIDPGHERAIDLLEAVRVHLDTTEPHRLGQFAQPIRDVPSDRSGIENSRMGTTKWRATSRMPARTEAAQEPITPTGSLADIGTELWSVGLTDQVRSTPAVGEDGAVYVVTQAGALHAISSQGQAMWRAVVGGAGSHSRSWIRIAPTGAIAVVFGNYLYSFSPKGSLAWKWTGRLGVTAPPAYGGTDRIFAMTNSSALHALSPNGTDLWAQELCRVTGGGTWPGPVHGASGLVYAVCKGRTIYCLDERDGRILWTHETNDRMESTPTVGQDGTAYFASTGGWIFAMDPAGHQRWLASVASPPGKIAMIDAPISVAPDGTIIVAPRHGTVYAIAPSGELLWQAVIGGQGTGGGPVAVGPAGEVYATNTSGEIVGIAPSGTEKVRITPSTRASSPAFGLDGTLDIGIGEKLHAIKPRI